MHLPSVHWLTPCTACAISQAEIEYFVRPGDKPHPKFGKVAGLQLQLFTSANQLAAKDTISMSLGEAVSKRMVANETLGYFIGRTYQFLLRAGCKAEHVRFRQHLPPPLSPSASPRFTAPVPSTGALPAAPA